MNRFISNLKLEVNDLYPEIGNWMVIAPLYYHSNIVKEIITVPAMFITDLATIPRILYPFINNSDYIIAAPSVVHDYLYKSKLIPRKKADLILYEAMLNNNSGNFKAKIVYLAVRMFGKRYYGR